MKRVLILAALLVMGVTGLVGCGETSTTTSNTNTESVVESVAEDTDNASEVVSAEESKADDSETSSGIGTKQSSITLVNNDEVSVKYNGIYRYSDDCLVLDLLIENKCDNERKFTPNNFVVNNCKISLANEYVNVPAHSKYSSTVNFDFIFLISDLQTYDIAKIKSLDFDLEIDDESYDKIHEYPIHIPCDYTVK
ncbi:MAG TPA: hypothetical protein DCW90_02080 [Lachnospiraceae bacterium]|nr:hypothetical protein [Lachnospiraceae bacterium]